MKQKGFTLIELLAVMVILGIVLVIAISTVSNVIENTKKESFKSSLKIAARKIKSYASLNEIPTGTLQSLELNSNFLEGTWEYNNNTVKFLAGTYEKNLKLIINYDVTLSELDTNFNPVAVDYLDNTTSNTYASTLSNTIGLPLKNYKIYGKSDQTVSTQGKNLIDKSNLISANTIQGATGKGYKLNLLPNTTYTIKSGLNKQGNVNSYNYYAWISNNINSNYVGYPVFHWNNNEGRTSTFTTDASSQYYFMTYNGGCPVSLQDVMTDLQLELGSTATSYEPFIPNSPSPEYLNLVKSVGETGKNIFDKSIIKAGYYVQWGTGLVYGSAGDLASDFIPVLPNTTYKTSGNTDGVRAVYGTIYCYSNSKSYISVLSPSSFTTPTGCYYIRYSTSVAYPSLAASTAAKAIFENTIQLEAGPAITEYKPFKYIDVISSGQSSSITTTIDLTGHEPLRKIDTAVDYIDYSNSRIVRNVGSMILNGSESWYKIAGYDNTTNVVFRLDFSRNNYLSMSDNLSVLYAGLTTANKSTYAPSLTGHTISINKYLLTGYNDTLTDAQKVSLFKTYLTSNNVKIYYILNTPIYEPITLPQIPTFNNETSISVLGGGSISADYYQKK